MAEAAAAAAMLPNHGGGSNAGSGTSTPGSRFKVDATGDSRKNSSGSAAGLVMLPPLPVNGDSSGLPPPPYNEGGDCMSKSPSAECDNGTKTASTELLSPGSREGELSVPIIALPDGELRVGARHKDTTHKQDFSNRTFVTFSTDACFDRFLIFPVRLT